MDTAVVEKDVRNFLAENFPLIDAATVVPGDESLVDAGIIDSTGVLELVEFLEDRYEIRISDEELLPDNLDSISRIATFVGRKLSTAAT